MIRVRLVGADTSELDAAAAAVARVLTLTNKSDPVRRRDGRGFSIYADAVLLAEPDDDVDVDSFGGPMSEAVRSEARRALRAEALGSPFPPERHGPGDHVWTFDAGEDLYLCGCGAHRGVDDEA